MMIVTRGQQVRQTAQRKVRAILPRRMAESVSAMDVISTQELDVTRVLRLFRVGGPRRRRGRRRPRRIGGGLLESDVGDAIRACVDRPGTWWIFGCHVLALEARKAVPAEIRRKFTPREKDDVQIVCKLDDPPTRCSRP